MKSVFWEVDSQHVQMLYMNKVNYEELLVCQKVGHICMHYCTLLLPSLTRHSCGPASSLFLTFFSPSRWQRVAFWIFELNFMDIKIISLCHKIYVTLFLSVATSGCCLNLWLMPGKNFLGFHLFFCIIIIFKVCNVNTSAKPLFWTFKTVRVCYS